MFSITSARTIIQHPNCIEHPRHDCGLVVSGGDTQMAAETMQFKTELKQLLHLIIHSLYSHKDIFLRELISNASDAIDTLRFQALTQHELARDGTDWKIKIIPDEKNGVLTISDN